MPKAFPQVLKINNMITIALYVAKLLKLAIHTPVSKHSIAFNLTFREEVNAEDTRHVREIVQSSNYFAAHEVAVAVQLVSDSLQNPESGEFRFLFAEYQNQMVGYTCFGLIPCTLESFDLYWIAVRETVRGQKIGSALLQRTESLIAQQGGKRVYIETSSRKHYESTRRFYNRADYKEEARIKDFYAPNDDKLIYVKVLDEENHSTR